MTAIRTRWVEGAPVVAIRVWLPGGSTAEPSPGQALASGRLLVEGTAKRTWRTIAIEAERRGIAIEADAGYEAQGLSIDALADDWELALDWAAELVFESVFPDERCRWVAQQAAAELDQLADHPDVRTSWAFDRQLYGSAARGRPLQGSAESLAALDGASCRSFHHDCLERGVILSVAGRVPESRVEARVRELFGGSATARFEPSPPVAGDDDSPGRQTVRLEDSEQAHWLAGAVTVSKPDPEYWALALLGIVLGAGGNLSGRISHRVREVEGLAYGCSVSAVGGAGRGLGCFSVSVGCSPDRLDQVEAAVFQELEKLLAGGVTPEELRDARAYVLGREPFARETARQWATLMAQSELFGVALDDGAWTTERWQAVTLEDLARVARRHLEPDRLKVTVGSPPRTDSPL